MRQVFKGIGGGIFLLFWGGLWSAATLTFDYVCVTGIWQQHRSTSYASVQGTVLESRVDSSSDSDGTSYDAVVKYSYRVKGRDYTSDKVRYGAKFSSSSHATAVVSNHPEESFVTVYYDPQNPSDSVLQTGVSGLDVFFIIFLIPFNAIMLACWYFAIAGIRKLISPPRAGGVRIIQDGVLTRVRVPETNALACAGGTAAGIAFVSIFALMFLSGGEPGLISSTLTLALALGSGAVVYARIQLPIWEGRKDLVLDDAKSRLTLPCTQGRKTSVEVPLTAVLRIDVDKESKTDNDGDTRYTWFPAIVFRENDVETKARLSSSTDEDATKSFASWLETRLKLKSAQAPSAIQ